MADPTQTELAILNLAINARDAMEGKGRITIAARNVDVLRGEDGKLRPGGYVIVSVTDTGCGMTRDVVEHAFDPFFTTKERGKGTGLGLSMVHGFASQSGGGAEIASQPGHGTTISLYLPKADAPPKRARRPSDGTVPGGGGTILLVDDEALGRMGIAVALRELGYDVVEARNAEDAIDVFARMPSVDLLITDHAMPGITGVELTAKIRLSHPGLKAILITGDTAFSCDGAASGVSAVIRKPFRMEDLAERIWNVLSPGEPVPKQPGGTVIPFGTRSGSGP